MSEITTSQRSEAEIQYAARMKRVMDAISLRKSDRVPIACYDDYFQLEQRGVKAAQAYYDPETASAAFVEGVVQFNWDMVSIFGNFPGRVGEILGLRTIKWAGYNLPESQQYQYVEREYMLADEYDQFLKDPSDFVIRTLWPRMANGFEIFGQLPSILAISHGFAPATEIADLLALPDTREMLLSLIKAGEEMEKYTTALGKMVEALKVQGFPVFVAPVSAAPFDWISDYFRGIRGSMMDMHYQPDKLKAAIEVLTQPLIDHAIRSAGELGVPFVEIPLHRGADPFMSNEQYAEFYWPSLNKLLLAILEAGLTPVPYWEGSYTSRLEFLAELPPGKIWSHFETVDLRRAKELLGHVMCFWGNVPSQILIYGTPEETSDYVKKLIDTFGDNGGLIIDGAVGIPKEAKYENVIAMTETVFEYGVY